MNELCCSASLLKKRADGLGPRLYARRIAVPYWRAVGKLDWAEALEQCLAKAERCQAMQDAVLDLR